uniref:helix-turn-helix domain-containing protein n=1 Tax=Paractinoplanes polyasparticus TaxID=2856853 RepID=UPI001C84B8D1|nr:helix-turn-helix transcriptional regulator [Actinoplanes polyasparticus]
MTDYRADESQPKPFRVADRLREAREASGLQQKELAAKLKWDPAKLSKTESGARTAVSEADVRAWAKATGMSDEDRDETLDLLARFKANEKSWRERMRHGRRSVQVQYNELYRTLMRFRAFQTAWIPGILQTADYARQIFADLNELDPETPIDIEADVEARMARREFLYDSSKEFDFILTESVLRTLIVDSKVMRAQLVRLEDFLDLPNVQIGILPQGRRLHTAPQSSFVLYDDMAIAEGFVIDNPYHGAQAQRFATVFKRMWSESVKGDAVREVIRKAIADLPQ